MSSDGGLGILIAYTFRSLASGDREDPGVICALSVRAEIRIGVPLQPRSMPMWMRTRKLVLDLMMAVCVGIALTACEHNAIAQDRKKEDLSAPSAAADVAVPALGPTMELMRPDPTRPLRSDATGASAGHWTAPSPGVVGDGDPKAPTTGDMYDRIVHNLFSVNMVWAMVTGFLVIFMQAAFAFVLHFRRLSGQEEEGFQ